MQTQSTNWTVTLFFSLLHLLTLAGLLLLWHHQSTPLATWLLAGAMYVVSGLSITVGYHRLFAHKSFKARPIVRGLLAVFGCCNFQGSVFEWCADHRLHHRHTDKDKDPYNIKLGFWHAHFKWLMTLAPDRHCYAEAVPDLHADPILRWQHKYSGVLMTLMGFFFPMLIATFWGDPWGGLLIAGGLRLILNLHSTWAINSVCHLFGKSHYIDQSARDHWITALFTFGEGFHNFHHKFPLDYRNGIRWFHFDPSKWLIFLLSRAKLASDLKRMPTSTILRYKVMYSSQAFHDRNQRHPLCHRIANSIQTRLQLMTSLTEQISEFENTLSELQKTLSQRPQCKQTRRQIRLFKLRIRRTYRQIRTLLKHGSYTLNTPAPDASL